jgi:hypothetical protein
VKLASGRPGWTLASRTRAHRRGDRFRAHSLRAAARRGAVAPWPHVAADHTASTTCRL